ncbi:MAG: VanZ family protein [Chitinophagaceae bacterium]
MTIFRLIRDLGSKLWVAISWTVLTLVLLCLPGSAIPGKGFFSIPHLDKVAHIILFGNFVLFWSLYAGRQKWAIVTLYYLIICIVLISISLGIAMEFIQLNYIPNRGFDVWDIGADGLGSVGVGLLLWQKGKQWEWIS